MLNNLVRSRQANVSVLVVVVAALDRCIMYDENTHDWIRGRVGSAYHNLGVSLSMARSKICYAYEDDFLSMKRAC